MTRSSKISVALIVAALLNVFAVMPFYAHAQGIPKQIVPVTCTGPSCDCSDLITLAGNVLNTAIYIAVVLSAVLFAWAGFRYMVYASSGEERSKVKELIRNVVVGLVILLSAWLIVDTLMGTLKVKLQNNGVWSAICG